MSRGHRVRAALGLVLSVLVVAGCQPGMTITEYERQQDLARCRAAGHPLADCEHPQKGPTR